MLLRHGSVEPQQVRDLVYGVLFTRSPKELHNSAIFVGGSNVERAEELFATVQKAFFGPFRTSVMFDANGANTTAAAAVLAVESHIDLNGSIAVVLGGTGPVGQRWQGSCACRSAGAHRLTRATAGRFDLYTFGPASSRWKLYRNCGRDSGCIASCSRWRRDSGSRGRGRCQIAARCTARQAARSLQVMVDLNAVSPLGIEGIDVQDKATERDGVVCYGAIGIGGTKMKIHARAIQRLFETNDAVLDADAIIEIGRELIKASAWHPRRVLRFADQYPIRAIYLKRSRP